MVFYSFVFYYMFIVFYYLYMLLCVHDVYLNIYLMYIHIVGIVLYYITCKLATRCIQIICTWHAYIFTFRLLLLLGRRGAQGVDQGGKPGRCLQAEKGRAGPNPSPLCFGEAVCLPPCQSQTTSRAPDTPLKHEKRLPRSKAICLHTCTLPIQCIGGPLWKTFSCLQPFGPYAVALRKLTSATRSTCVCCSICIQKKIYIYIYIVQCVSKLVFNPSNYRTIYSYKL